LGKPLNKICILFLEATGRLSNDVGYNETDMAGAMNFPYLGMEREYL
jgi:hypothetical protein